MADAYRKALKRGEQDARRAVAEGRHPYLTDLEGIVLEGQTAGRESCGTLEIPLDMVVGTVTRGRQAAFSRTFLPLLDADSEFAIKWGRLYDIQVEEGYRDPIRVTEFMHRFYVQEGNKRASVLKYLGAHTVTAEVTRLYPSRWEGVERRLYGEFCEFWRACPIYDIEFSREGRYKALAQAFGRDLSSPWPADAVDYLRQSYLFFANAYERAGGAHLDITPADAMLVYLGVYTQDRILDVPSSIVIDRLGLIWRELVMQGKSDDEKVDLVEAPDVSDEGTAVPATSGVLNFFMGKTTYTERRPLRVAFVHDQSCAASGWAYAHDLGRQHLDDFFGGIVRTSVYEDRADEASFMEAVDSAAKNGADVVFSTSPALMDATVKAAVRHPRLRFLNCSVGMPHQLVRSYYGKMYEAKFLLGALAASLADDHRVGYRAHYPHHGHHRGDKRLRHRRRARGPARPRGSELVSRRRRGPRAGHARAGRVGDERLGRGQALGRGGGIRPAPSQRRRDARRRGARVALGPILRAHRAQLAPRVVGLGGGARRQCDGGRRSGRGTGRLRRREGRELLVRP